MLEAKRARRPSTISAGKNATSVRAIGMTLAFQPRLAPSARSALQRVIDQSAASRPAARPVVAVEADVVDLPSITSGLRSARPRASGRPGAARAAPASRVGGRVAHGAEHRVGVRAGRRAGGRRAPPR